LVANDASSFWLPTVDIGSASQKPQKPRDLVVDLDLASTMALDDINSNKIGFQILFANS